MGRGIRFSPDSRYLAASLYSSDSKAIVWDLKNLDAKPILLKVQNRAVCNALSFTSDSWHLVAYMRAPVHDDFLISWDVQTGKEDWRTKLGNGYKTIKCSPDSDVVSVDNADNDGKPFALWFSTKSGASVAAPKVTDALPAARAFTLAVKGKTITVKSSAGGPDIQLQALDDIHAMCLCKDKLVIAAVGFGVQIWDVSSGKLLFNLGDPKPQPGGSLFSSETQPSSVFLKPIQQAIQPASQPAEKQRQ